ncbi:MAG: glycosyltransferase family 2 protein [Bdellovibrionota bacterium]
MVHIPLSATIITLNEETNIARAINSVSWADEVIVVDSGSTDKTVEIAEKLGAKVMQNPWPGYGQQKNFAQNSVKHDWVINIDADEEVSPALAKEITESLYAVADGRISAHGFEFSRKTSYVGQWIHHGGWYPNYLVRLADRRFAKWTEPNVHEVLIVRGQVKRLNGELFHFAFNTIEEQVLTNLRFSKLGALDLECLGRRPSILMLFLKPLGKFLETYILKRGFLDGIAGLIISVNAAHSIFLKYAYQFEKKIKGKK